jgi:hypothetical protein
LEAAIGIEPMNKGFADLCLTTWLRRLTEKAKGKGKKAKTESVFPFYFFLFPFALKLERETRFELATLALARRCSTTELLPLLVTRFDSND